MEKRKRRFGDRKEGRRIRTLPPMSYVEPYIMKSRNDAQIFMDDTFDITETDKLMRQLRDKGYKNLSILHVIIAAYIQAIAVRPGANRFCSGQKIYHRDAIEINMAVKKEMSLKAPDTMIKVRFAPTDTLLDVYEKFNSAVTAAVAEGGNENFEKTARLLTKLPGFMFRFAVSVLNFLDYHGWLPQFLLDISPFHGSMIITSMGSLGIPPVFHHLYNFGNLPVFLSYGAKYHKIMEINGEMQKRTMIDFKAVVDERICDGYYYASVFKLLRKMVSSPAVLLTPPEKILEDID